MGTTLTSKAKLAVPTPGTTSYTPIWQGDMNALDGMNSVGGLCVTTHEQPSASLLVDIAAGSYVNSSGVISSYAGATSQAMTASTTTYLWLTNSGVLTTGTAWPAAGTAIVPLAIVVAGATTITSITDARACFAVAGIAYLPTAGGTLSDGANIAVGATTGTQIATATTQKLGFWGHAPAAQPVGGTDLIAALASVGLIVSASTPLSLQGGALTVGSATLADGGNVTVGSTTGTQIGTATTQKLGFFGQTPAAQPTMGAATAGASYTANEQTMLQAVYNAVRALGLGS